MIEQIHKTYGNIKYKNNKDLIKLHISYDNEILHKKLKIYKEIIDRKNI